MTAAVDRLRPYLVLGARQPARIPGPRAARPLFRLSCASAPAVPPIRWIEGLQPRHWSIESIEAELDDGGHGAAAAEAGEVIPAEIVVIAEGERPPAPGLDEESAPWLLIGLVTSVIAIVVAGVVILRAGTDHPGRTAAVPASATSGPASVASAQRARAVAWIVDALDRHSVLVTDDLTRASLLAQGLAADAVLAAGQPLPATANFVVATAQLRDRAAAGQDPAVARLLAESKPVARFGSGADSVQVREVIPTGTRPGAATANQTMAGRALLGNKALSVVPEAVTPLSQGRLDLRAATLIAALAARAPIRLIGLAQQQVEASADAPIRTVQLDLGDSPGLLSEYVDALPATYRPATWLRQSDGSFVVQWHPDLATAAPVS